MIRYRCPSPDCNQMLGMDESHAGAATECPMCGTRHRVPTASPREAGQTSQPVRSSAQGEGRSGDKVSVRCQSCNRRIRVRSDLIGRRAKCPGCGEVTRLTPGLSENASPTEIRIDDLQKAETALQRKAPEKASPREASDEQEIRDAEVVRVQEERKREVKGLAPAELNSLLLHAGRKSRELRDTNEPESQQLLSQMLEVDLQRWMIEEILIQRSVSNGFASLPARNRLGEPIAQFLNSPLGPQICSTEVRIGLNAQNPFRLLALPAHASNARISQVTASLGKKRNSRGWQPLGIGYHIWQEDNSGSARSGSQAALRSAQTLNHGRTRLSHELFWLHLPEKDCRTINNLGGLASPITIEILRHRLDHASGEDALLLLHALAIAMHNVALTRELAFAAGVLKSATGYWESAWQLWQYVLGSEGFATYMHSRAEKLRAGNELNGNLREQVSLALASINARFAIVYGQEGHDVAAHRHLSILSQARMPESVRQSALMAGVKAGFY